MKTQMPFKAIIKVLLLALSIYLINTPYSKNYLSAYSNIESKPYALKEDGTLLVFDKDMTEADEILEDVVQVSSGSWLSYAVKNDGIVWRWDYESDNGYIYTTEPTQVFNEVKHVDIYGNITYIIKNDNTLWKFIDEDNPEKVLNDVKTIKNYGNNAFAITEDDTLWGWGYNAFGQTATGNNRSSDKPHEILENVNFVLEVEDTVYAIQKDGTLYLWGINKNLGKKEVLYKPTYVAKDVVKIEANRHCVYFLKRDGSLWSLGYGNNGRQIDDYDKAEPIEIANDIKDFSISTADYYNDYAIKENGDLLALFSGYDVVATKTIMNNVAFVKSFFDTTYAIKEDRSLWAWGNNSNGEVGDGTLEFVKEPYKTLENVEYMEFGTQFSGAVTTNGDYYVFGMKDYDGDRQILEEEWRKDKSVLINSPRKIAENISTKNVESVKLNYYGSIIGGYSTSVFTFKKFVGWLILVWLTILFIKQKKLKTKNKK